MSASAYDDATVENPLTFGLNVERDGKRWLTYCDGMPSYTGCGSVLRTNKPVAYSRHTVRGWLICFGSNDDGSDDTMAVLAFCPRCAAVVRSQAREVQP